MDAMTRRAAVLALTVFAVLTLAGCTGDVGPSVADRVLAREVPTSWDGPEPDVEDLETLVGWVGDGEFGVITWGSGSCLPVAHTLETLGAHEVRVLFAYPNYEACTTDLAASTHVFTLPDGVVAPVTVTVVDEERGTETDLTLP